MGPQNGERLGDLLARELFDLRNSVIGILEERAPALLSTLIDGASWIRPPWDHRVDWAPPDGPWILRFLKEAGPDLLGPFVACGGLLPAPEERVLARMGLAATSGEAHVFLVDGNVQDLQVDGHLGYAPLPHVLEHHWLRGGVFGGSHHRAFLRCTLSVGLELGPETAQVADPSLAAFLEEHHREVEGLAPELRLERDLALIDSLRQDAAHPHTLVLFERPALAFPSDARGANRNLALIDSLLRWARQPSTQGGVGSLVVLATDDAEGLSPELRRRSSGILSLTLPWPDRAEDRGRFIIAALTGTGLGAVPMPHTRLARVRASLPFHSSHVSRIMHATAGLNHVGIESCFLQHLQEGTVGAEPALATLGALRAELLRSESQGLLDLEDLDHVEPPPLEGEGARILEELEWVVEGMAADPADPRSKVLPMGILFVGVPGTGKSLVARHLAIRCQRRADVHFVRLGDFRDMWVGSTERNFARILRLLGSFGRAIVFMDEIDQSEGSSRTGERHETSRRVFGRLLQFMADDRHRGRLLWIAATNRPDLLDSALVRPGRFDEVVSFQPPDSASCAAILRAHLRNSCPIPAPLTDDELEALARVAEAKKLVGSELELVVLAAARQAIRNQRSELDAALLGRTLDRLRVSYKEVGGYPEMERACASFVRFAREPAE